ncbi:RecX family transcriptional regulator [Mucilaginibacter rubeus]|uniref:Regulatory protein RecX n=1 Tax=Mucilaginibacter rubeus TaxID=2027860 RepID=A0AAE6MGK7_9SPHI|nr:MULTISPECIES: regulatory protein RecX [Mucilaginibacter]QEM02616.1 RecX family transcriptional regulator [Mucilaginibacter rubeus]QEM15237.1 RecX family transcriptional regulator [Mucilaginibacter gossypii]QTE42039.1 RecX family transcriptional regulator [Mucilaginibacter rubeus]QTE48640.1 RecX family transcriptional regulator [Mucilaginibacter rubeus]QTE60026.1 RecX family transcriptional regulator [Mucilaginibacter rubeus]
MDQPKSIKITDEKVALAKAEHFCAYQERAQQEVRDKLYEWGLWPDAVERIISQLIEGNFLNEERFARIYAKSKFNQKAWGRIKIKQGLKLKRVPDVLIKKALLTIDPDDYLTALTHLLQKKEATLNEKNQLKRRYKLQQYAIGRGFEAELIADILKNSKL